MSRSTTTHSPTFKSGSCETQESQRRTATPTPCTIPRHTHPARTPPLTPARTPPLTHCTHTLLAHLHSPLHAHLHPHTHTQVPQLRYTGESRTHSSTHTLHAYLHTHAHSQKDLRVNLGIGWSIMACTVFKIGTGCLLMIAFLSSSILRISGLRCDRLAKIIQDRKQQCEVFVVQI